MLFCRVQVTELKVAEMSKCLIGENNKMSNVMLSNTHIVDPFSCRGNYIIFIFSNSTFRCFGNFQFDNSKFDIPTFDNSKFDIPTFDNSKFDIPTFDNSKFDIPTFDNSKFDIPTFDNSKFDIPTFYRFTYCALFMYTLFR
jgi:hypothetical protein